MKNPGETHDEMQVNTAPISMCEYPATIAKAAGLDYTAYGTPVDEISQDTQRERTVWVRLFVPGLPSVGKYSGTGVAAENAYCGFTYTGGIEELLQTYDDGADIVVQEVDSFY